MKLLTFLFAGMLAVSSMSRASDTFEATRENSAAAPGAAPDGMVWIPGGEFSMGSLDPTKSHCEGTGHEPMQDARPIHRVYVDGFWMDKTEVTNEQFAQFVAASNYVTVSERKPKPEDVPGAPLEALVAGSIVFTAPDGPVDLRDVLSWWRYVPGASWQHPAGPDSDIKGKEKVAAVHIAYEDAVAYCNWAGKRLPTEAEWEFAARGGEAGKPFTWGDEIKPGGKWMANIFQGHFPDKNTVEDGFAGIAPVAQFPPNKYGLYDMAGNAWEWCSDWYRPDYYEQLEKTVGVGPVVARNPKGPESSFDPDEPNQPKRIQRGGSFLCSDQYCTRYMVGTRGKGEPMSAANHIGFRCVKIPNEAPRK